MSDMLRFVKYALAVFRITHLLWYENGPWHIFDWIRAKAGIRYEPECVPVVVSSDNATFWATPEPEVVRHTDGSFLAELLNCPLCLSVWLGFMAMLGYRLRIRWAEAIVDWLAISAIPLLLFGWERGDK